MLATVTTLFAQIPWQPSQSELAGLMVIGGLMFICSVLDSVLKVWDRLFPKSTFTGDLRRMEKEIAETYATKESLKVVEARLALDTKTQNQKLENIESLVSKGFTDIARSLGRVEGQLEKNGKE